VAALHSALDVGMGGFFSGRAAATSGQAAASSGGRAAGVDPHTSEQRRCDRRHAHRWWDTAMCMDARSERDVATALASLVRMLDDGQSIDEIGGPERERASNARPWHSSPSVNALFSNPGLWHSSLRPSSR